MKRIYIIYTIVFLYALIIFGIANIFEYKPHRWHKNRIEKYTQYHLAQFLLRVAKEDNDPWMKLYDFQFEFRKNNNIKSASVLLKALELPLMLRRFLYVRKPIPSKQGNSNGLLLRQRMNKLYQDVEYQQYILRKVRDISLEQFSIQDQLDDLFGQYLNQFRSMGISSMILEKNGKIQVNVGETFQFDTLQLSEELVKIDPVFDQFKMLEICKWYYA